METLYQLFETIELSDSQKIWLTKPVNKSDALFIASLWQENNEYDEEIATLVVNINIGSIASIYRNLG